MVNGIQGGISPNLQAMESMREKMFSDLDPDGNGQIELENLAEQIKSSNIPSEHADKLIESLKAADTNNDGVVSKDEFNQMKPPDHGPKGGKKPGVMTDLIDQLSANGQIDLSQFLSEAEESDGTDDFLAQILEDLQNADADQDGILTKAEFDQMMTEKASASQMNQPYSNFDPLNGESGLLFDGRI